MEQEYITVSSKGQIVIPAKTRAALGIEAGTRVRFSVEGGRMILDAQSQSSTLRLIEQLRGCTGGGGTELLLEERRRERARENW
jgi:AbrB family looped-hinge helix DNA binding protein